MREVHNSAMDTATAMKGELAEIKQLSAPFMEQLGGENICRTNIDNTISSVKQILAEIKETETLVALLKSK